MISKQTANFGISTAGGRTSYTPAGSAASWRARGKDPCQVERDDLKAYLQAIRDRGLMTQFSHRNVGLIWIS